MNYMVMLFITLALVHVFPVIGVVCMVYAAFTIAALLVLRMRTKRVARDTSLTITKR